MGNSCSNVTNKQTEAIKEQVTAGLKKLGINTGDLSRVDIEAALNNIMSIKSYTIETLFAPEHKQEIMNAIATARQKKIAEDAFLKKNTIGGAKVHIGERFEKTSPSKNPTTLYVFTDNLQAHNALTTEKIGVPGLITVKDGVTVNVSSTSAMLRTNTNGDKNPNTIGFVVKKNAQDKDGKWLNNGQGVFEDTDEEFEAFTKINTQIAKEIKERLEAESSAITDLQIVDKIAIDKAGLPKRFAEALQSILYNQLGISTQILPSGFGENLYGLEIQPFGETNSQRKQKSAAQEAREKDSTEASKSLETERPTLISDNLSINQNDINILARVFPNIEERIARVSFISTVFSQQISNLLSTFVPQYEALMQDSHTIEDEKIYTAITTGTEAERRKAFLEMVPIEGTNGSTTSVANYIVSTIQDFMKTVINVTQALNNGELTEDEAISLVFDSNNYVATEFKYEAQDKGWYGKVLRTKKLQRLRLLASQFEVMINPQVFDALLRDAATDIEFNENLRIIMENGHALIENTDEDNQNNEDEGDGSVDNRSGLNLIKYKLLNPAKTLSTRMKTMLAQLYKMKNGKYEYNSLGQRVRMNSSVAYYILLHHFSAMNRPEDFEGALDEVVEKYPWMAALADKLDADEDLRNEFYTTFRKIFVTYALIGINGKVNNLNQTANRETFMHEATRLYEGHTPLSENSIYDVEGLCDTKNVAKVHRWVSKEKNIKAEDIIKKHPLYWVKNIFDNPNRRDYNATNILKAISILRGEEKNTPGIVDLLHALGVPTETLDIDVLVPYIDDDLKSRLISNDANIKADAFNELNDKINVVVRGNISKIIQSAINITRNEKGFSPGDNLLDDFEGAYNNIADALSISSEAFSQASFLGMENNQMFSYTMPDRVSILVGILSKAKTLEEAQLYLEKEYGQYDFFRDANTREWMNSWLEDIYENSAIRQAMAYVNVLGFNSRKKGNSIQDVDNDTFTDGIITAMFSANDAADGTKMGWYRNPLFSDTSALVLLKMKRYSGNGYKDAILDRLVKVMRQEISRIITVSDQDADAPIIEFYNDKKGNARKFNYFPELNSKREEILETFADIEDEYGVSATRTKEEQDKYLKDVLIELIEGTLLEDGTRIGGLLNDFLNDINEERGLKILKSITSLENSDKKNEDVTSYKENLEDEEDVEDVEDLTPEDIEAKKAILSAKQKEEIREKLTEFFYNDFFGQIQFTQMLGGDLAQYKSFDDFVKRCKENYAAGERMYSLDANGNRITEKVMYVEDLEAISTTWTNIRDLLDSDNPNLSDWEKGIYKGAVEMFKNITTTDGQSFRTLDSYKKLFKAYGGRWTVAMDNAFNNIKSGKFTAVDFLALWNPIKPFMVSHESVQIKDKEGNIRNEKVTTQHKNSEYLISALFGVLNTALNNSPQLRGLQRFMENHNVDVMHFHSVVKHGYHDGFDINYDYRSFENDLINASIATNSDNITFRVGNEKIILNVKTDDFSTYQKKLLDLLDKGKISQEEYNNALSEYEFKSEEDVVDALESQLMHEVNGEWVENERMFKTFPLEDYMIVQPTEDHLIDHDALFGSQLRNIVPADLPADFTTVVKINGQDITLNREQFVAYYNTLIVDQLLDSFDSVDTKFNNDRALSDFLQEMMRGNPKYGEDVKAALSIDPKTGTFKVPLNSPNLRNKVEELLLSVFKNNIQRQKIRGGNVVLVSNFGLSDKLRVQYKADGSIDYIPAYMPAYMREMYEDYLIEKTDKDGSTYWTLDFDALRRNNNEDILKIIGYRIPTEDKYSIMPIKIIGFMPVVAGTTIMLPADIISMSGTDFDIDKLFLMIRTTVRETYGRNLTDKFREWLSPELRKSLTNTDPEQSKVIEKILHRKGGYTDEQVNTLADQSELFEQFMEEEGYEYQHERPIYRVKRGENIFNEDGTINLSETSKLSNKNKKERHDIRNNMLIDTIWSVLTSKPGSRLAVTPGSYPGVKRGSRQQWILNNVGALKKFIEFAGGTQNIYSKLMSMTTKELERFFEEYASPENPMTLNAYVKKHRNLMDGNALIGVFAVNSSNHYKLQFLSPGTIDADGNYIPSENILLNEANVFWFKLPNETTKKVILVSPQKSPITGVSIGRTAAEFQAASPDNGKDPCLGDLGASIKTAYRINFLIHMGFPPEIIGMLNTIDDFIEYGSQQETTSKEPFNGDITRILELVAKFRTSDTGTLNDPIDREDAKKIANWMNNIFKCARTFSTISTISRVDSPNGALPVKVAEVVQQLLKMEDFFTIAKSKECEIRGLDRLIDDSIDINNYINDPEGLRQRFQNSPIPRLQAVYTLGIKNARTLAGSQLVELRKPFIEAVRLLRNQTKNSLLGGNSVSTLQKFFSEMTMFFLSSEGSLFAQDTEGKSIMELRNYYIHDFPMKLRAFLDAKDTNGKYLHSDIRNLTLLRRISNGNRSGIKFNNIGKVSPQSRKHYTEAMDSLLYDPDPEVQKLAIDLLMYAYYDNGLNFGPSNYGIFFTTYFLSTVPGVMDVLRRINGEAESSPNILTNFVNQFILNHKDLAFTPRKGNYQIIKYKGDYIEVAQKDADFLRSGISSTGDFVTYVNYRGNIYQRVIGEENASKSVVRYKKISSNNTDRVNGEKDGKNFTPFYDATKDASEIEWDKLANRGAVTGDNSKKKTPSTKNVPTEEKSKEAPVEGKNTPQEMEEKIGTNIVTAMEELEASTDDFDAVTMEKKLAKIESSVERIATSIERIEQQGVQAPKEPELTEFPDNADPSNRLCPPSK